MQNRLERSRTCQRKANISKRRSLRHYLESVTGSTSINKGNSDRRSNQSTGAEKQRAQRRSRRQIIRRYRHHQLERRKNKLNQQEEDTSSGGAQGGNKQYQSKPGREKEAKHDKTNEREQRSGTKGGGQDHGSGARDDTEMKNHGSGSGPRTEPKREGRGSS